MVGWWDGLSLRGLRKFGSQFGTVSVLRRGGRQGCGVEGGASGVTNPRRAGRRRGLDEVVVGPPSQATARQSSLRRRLI